MYYHLGIGLVLIFLTWKALLSSVQIVDSLHVGDLLDSNTLSIGTTTTPARHAAAKIQKAPLFNDFSLKQDGDGYSHCFYRDYHTPPLHSGLPIIGEMFASFNRESVYILAEGRKYCQLQYDHHDYHANSSHVGVQFDCIFEADQSKTISDPIFPTSKPYRMSTGLVLIRCPVPQHLQSTLPESGAFQTSSYLTLQSKMDLITRQNFSPEKAPQLKRLPICSHAWPSEKPEETIQADKNVGEKRHNQPKFMASVMTRISVSYRRGKDNEKLTVQREDFVAWLEYHLAIGIEHFYIYDDSPFSHNSTVLEWTLPYRKESLVTYVHYPKNDIDCDHPDWKSKQMYMAQVISSNGAIRRYEQETKWLGHWDVDEYLVFPSPTGQRQGNNNTSLGSIGLTALLDHQVDEISLQRPTYGPCQNSAKHRPDPKNALVIDINRCRHFNNANVGKGLFKASTVLHFRVHKAKNLLSGSTAVRAFKAPAHQVHLAHFRRGRAGGVHFPDPADKAFEPWIKPLQKLVQQRLSQ